MATAVQAIMGAFKTRLMTVDARLNCYDHAPGSPLAPAAFPLVPAFSYRESMGRGTYVLQFRVAVLVANQLDREGQFLLAEFASQTGARSIRAALEGDKKLGGLVHDLVVDSFDPTGLEDTPGLGGYIGGIFNVRVIASGV